MIPELDEEYLTWLYSKVYSVKSRSRARSYWALFRQLYEKEFVWFVPNDDNRVEDGRQLQQEFLDEIGVNAPISHRCSVLEMMLALSRRASFLAGNTPRWWFRTMLDNLGFPYATDSDPVPYEVLEEALDRMIWRTYSPDGTGGLFPLRHPKEDQTKVELWYQLNAYLIERF